MIRQSAPANRGTPSIAQQTEDREARVSPRDDTTSSDPALPLNQRMDRRSSVLRNVFFLALAAAALLTYIGTTGFVRRKGNAIAQGERHAQALMLRMGDSRQLPLNLELQPQTDAKGRSITFEWLDRESARILRGRDERIIAAQSTALPGMFVRRGRVVMFFEDGTFDVKWLALRDFDRLAADQDSLLRRLKSEVPPAD